MRQIVIVFDISWLLAFSTEIQEPTVLAVELETDCSFVNMSSFPRHNVRQLQ